MMKDKSKAKGFFREFKEFISRGSVMDLAVGMIIGAAFTAIVKALVDNVLNPIIGLFTGGLDFSKLMIPLTKEGAEGASIQLGLFINAVISFFITAFVIFLLIKGMNKLNRNKQAKPEKKPRLCPYCKSEIADDATRCPYCTSMLEEPQNNAGDAGKDIK
jgi:large conductance mechanosensitive channel